MIANDKDSTSPVVSHRHSEKQNKIKQGMVSFYKSKNSANIGEGKPQTQANAKLFGQKTNRNPFQEPN